MAALSSLFFGALCLIWLIIELLVVLFNVNLVMLSRSIRMFFYSRVVLDDVVCVLLLYAVFCL